MWPQQDFYILIWSMPTLPFRVSPWALWLCWGDAVKVCRTCLGIISDGRRTESGFSDIGLNSNLFQNFMGKNVLLVPVVSGRTTRSSDYNQLCKYWKFYIIIIIMYLFNLNVLFQCLEQCLEYSRYSNKYLLNEWMNKRMNGVSHLILTRSIAGHQENRLGCPLLPSLWPSANDFTSGSPHSLSSKMVLARAKEKYVKFPAPNRCFTPAVSFLLPPSFLPSLLYDN